MCVIFLLLFLCDTTISYYEHNSRVFVNILMLLILLSINIRVVSAEREKYF